MRLMLFNSSFPPLATIGGGDKIADCLVRELRESGVDIDVVTTQPNRHHRFPAWVHPILHTEGDWGAGRRGSILQRTRQAVVSRLDHRRAMTLLRSLRPDVVILGDITNAKPSIAWACRDCRIPVVYWCFSETVMEGVFETNSRLLRQVMRLTGGGEPALRPGASFAGIIACSRYLLERMKMRGFAAPFERAILHGVPTDIFRPSDDASFSKQRRILWVSRLTPEKGYPEALESLAHLCRRNKQVSLSVAGASTEYRADFQERIRTLGIESCVEYLGYEADSRNLAEIYRRHDIYWMTSRLPEGLPLTLLEAMASGLGIVATSVGGTPEAFEEGREGLFVPPNDAVALAAATEKMLRDPAMLAKMRAAARNRAASHFSMKRMGDEFMTFCSQVVAWSAPHSAKVRLSSRRLESIPPELICPACGAQEFIREKRALKCVQCRALFFVDNDIPDMRLKAVAVDMAAGRGAWSRWKHVRNEFFRWRRNASAYVRPLPSYHRAAAEWALERSKLTGRPVLDVGCKNGVMGCFMKGRPYLGIEPDPVDPYPFSIFRGVGESLPFAFGSIGVVLSLAALDYAVDPARTLAECRRVLATDGSLVLILTLHSPEICARLRRTSFLHHSYFTKEDLWELAEAAGFKRRREQRFGDVLLAEFELSAS